MFVQRMPVTKVVNEITIGDLALGPGCSVGTANAKIEEYENREIGGSGGVFYSSSPQPLTSTPSKITWAFAPVTFRKDRGYAIRVSMIGGCSSFNQTTWAHNEPRVNPGQLRCAKGPQGWRRMWHEMGTDDRLAGCVDPPPGQGIFDPSMPTGWLISQIGQNGSGIWDVRKFSTASTPVCNTPNPPNTYEQYGGTPIFWRSSLSFPYNPEYTCRWTQWADFGEQPQDGWYYAQPWLAERTGAPRDMYLKLDTIDYDALLDAHSPIVLYDSDEAFRSISPAAATDFFDASDDPEDANRLVDGDGAFASANPAVAASTGIDTLGLSYLSDSYAIGPGRRSDTAAEAGDYLSYRGGSAFDYFDDASAMDVLPGYGNQTYGRAVHDSSGNLWLQYWLYYYFDPQVNFFGSGEHEGDWEMVQVRLSSGAPDRAAYAQHGGGEVCPWSEVAVSGQRPIVYVAGDSHGSYFRSGTYTDPDPDERADGLGGVFQPDLNQIWMESIDWLRWPGTWGDSGASPDGPAFQGSKWVDPGAWAEGLSPCDVD
jgi:hypothetical protein